MIYVADACALICYLTDDGRLGAAGNALLDSADSELVVPGIALFEIEYTFPRGKHAASGEGVLRLLSGRPNSRVLLLSTEAAVEQHTTPVNKILAAQRGKGKGGEKLLHQPTRISCLQPIFISLHRISGYT